MVGGTFFGLLVGDTVGDEAKQRKKESGFYT
jgi:hypothetical protein